MALHALLTCSRNGTDRLHLPPAGQDAVNLLNQNLCSPWLAVNGAINDLLWQGDVMLREKLQT